MGPFYAYLKHAREDNTWRFLITFVDREAADEWWRMISTPPSPYAGEVKRISAQFYVYTNSNVAYFLDHGGLPEAKQFLERMFVTEIGNRGSNNPTIFQPIEVTDHLSRKWYFIRSKADPWSHWYFRTDDACLVCGDENCDAIHVSSEYRTKFCVRALHQANDSQDSSRGFVMIGRDDISITTPMNHTLYINDGRDLKATTGYQGETDLLFSDLRTRFITRAKKQVNGEVWEYVVPVERGLGESWELVD